MDEKVNGGDADSLQRASTGIPGLDEVLLGGFLVENVYLIQGTPGSGKTTLGMQFLIEGVLLSLLGAVLGLGLNVGAYGAEVVRGAIQAVPRGQWEATVALNMARSEALRRIILPQAFVAMIPPWGNLFIELLKATALVSLITITDLSFKAQEMNQTTLKTVDIFSLVLLIYLALSLAITIGMRLMEAGASRGLARGRMH